MATTLLEIPAWVQRAVGISEMNVYVNSEDNSDYVVYDTARELVTPVCSSNLWGRVEYDREVYEEHRQIMYSPPQKAPDSSSPPPTPTTEKAPFRAAAVKRKSPTTFSGFKKRAREAPRDEDGHDPGYVSKPEFVDRFVSMKDRPSVSLLCTVYDLLDGFKITPQVLDVVTDLVEFVCTKSLKNTMGCKKRSKTFKAQLSYLLVKMALAKNDDNDEQKDVCGTQKKQEQDRL